MDYTSAVGDRDLRRIGHIRPIKRTVTPASERKRLIEQLITVGNHHRKNALREIEAR